MELTREQVETMFGVSGGRELSGFPYELQPSTVNMLLAHDAALRLRCEEAERMQARWKVLASMTKECACVWGINETPDDQYCGGEHNDTIEQLCLAHQKMFDKQLADLTEKLAEMTEELENYRSIAEREGATIAVSELVVLKTQLQAMTKERDEYEAYSHLANRTLDDVTAPLKQQLATAQAENVRLRKALGHFNRTAFEKAPCYICGYNGIEYYQPSTHPCAKLFHEQALNTQEPT